MLKELYDRIQETAQPQIVEIGGVTYLVSQNGEISEFYPKAILPDTLPLNSLDALVQLVKTEFSYRLEEDRTALYITIPDHLTVRCFGHPDYEQRAVRPVYYEANATDVPGWDERVQLPFEEMQIALRTRFQETADTPYIQKLLTEISTGAKITFNDNGVATTVVTKKGIDLQNNETIRPIITLRPYRTFQEIDQPESVFLIRINERGISFIEADGGMWKLKARETIKAFLEDKLANEINAGAVVVAL